MLSTDEVVKKYKSLKPTSKSALATAFCKEFNFKTKETLRARIRGDEKFLIIHLEYLSRMLPKFEDAEIPEIVSEK